MQGPDGGPWPWEPREPRRSSSGRQEARAEGTAPGVTVQSHPGLRSRAGAGQPGGGTGEKILGGSQQEPRGSPRVSRGSTDSGHGKTSAGPWAKSGSRDPARFTFFLAAANLLCRVSSDIPGHGGGEAGPHHLDPGTHCGSIR